MSNRKLKINQIAHLNLETYTKESLPDIIEYLDTGSIVRNKIVSFQQYKKNSDEIPSRAQRKVKKNTILYSTVRPNLEHHGILENPKDNLVVSTGFTTLDIYDNTVDPKYIYYNIAQKHYTDYLHTIATNNVSSYPSIKPDDLGNLVLSIPEKLEEQQRIAAVLSSLDAKIELNNRINTQLEAMAKTLYDYWFVQFDFPFDFDKGEPCSHNLDKDGKKTCSCKPYKSSGGKMVWNEQLKREIPEGWEVKKVEDYCRIFTGKKDVNQALENGRYKFFSCAPGYKYSDEKLYEGKAILVSGNGSYTGRTVFVDEGFDLYQRTYACVNRTGIDYLAYIYFSMLRYMSIKIGGGTHGSAIPYIVFDDIAKEILVINHDLINCFQQIVYPIIKEIMKFNKQSDELTNLRDFLLPMLMNGQVKVV